MHHIKVKNEIIRFRRDICKKLRLNAQRFKIKQIYYLFYIFLQILCPGSSLTVFRQFLPSRTMETKCDICDLILSTKQALVHHMRTNNGEKPYQC